MYFLEPLEIAGSEFFKLDAFLMPNQHHRLSDDQ